MTARVFGLISGLLGVLLAGSFVVPMDQWLMTATRNAAPVPVVGTTEFPAAQVWTATRDRTADENAAAHFAKHRSDFKFASVNDYVAAASTFLHTPPAGVQTARQRDGDVMRFNPSTGEFAVMRRDGTPRTYFILDPAIHGYSSNQDYFNAYIAP